MELLRDAMDTQLAQNPDGYNEFVVTAEYWEAHLPDVLEAMVCTFECDTAREIHARFLRRYNTTAVDFPLVLYWEGRFYNYTY